MENGDDFYCNFIKNEIFKLKKSIAIIKTYSSAKFSCIILSNFPIIDIHSPNNLIHFMLCNLTHEKFFAIKKIMEAAENFYDTRKKKISGYR